MSNRRFAQFFSRAEPEFRLDEHTNRLVLTGDIVDLQEKVNSSYSDTLFSHLERYFNDNPLDYDELIKSFSSYQPDLDDVPDFVLDMQDDGKLDSLLKCFNKVYQYREKYDIPDYLSDSDVLGYVRAQAEKVKTGREEDIKNEISSQDGPAQPPSQSQELPSLQSEDSSPQS